MPHRALAWNPEALLSKDVKSQVSQKFIINASSFCHSHTRAIKPLRPTSNLQPGLGVCALVWQDRQSTYFPYACAWLVFQAAPRLEGYQFSCFRHQPVMSLAVSHRPSQHLATRTSPMDSKTGLIKIEGWSSRVPVLCSYLHPPCYPIVHYAVLPFTRPR